MTSFTPGPLTAHKECVFFANKAGGFSLSDCPAAEANAHRIARCWNSHAELLEALKQWVDPFSDDIILQISDDYGVGTAKRVEASRAAIAKATS